MLDWKEWGYGFDESRPIYLQIIEKFKQSIVRGDLPLGERVLSIRELAAGLRVNPNTVHRAYQEMERNGLIYSQRGMGYYVTEDKEKIMVILEDLAKSSVERFLAEMHSIGLSSDQILTLLQKTMKEGEEHNEQPN